MNPATACTTSSAHESADGTPEEPLPADIPRDDLEAVEHGGIAKPGPPSTEDMLRAERDKWRARALQNRAEARRAEAELQVSIDEVVKMRKKSEKNRKQGLTLRRRMEEAEEQLEQAHATIAHLRGIAGVVTEDEAA